MRVPYRYKLFLKKTLRVLLITLAALFVLTLAVLVYLEPYLVYDRDGVHLDFSDRRTPDASSPTVPEQPSVPDASFIQVEPSESGRLLSETGGYYITTSMLLEPEKVLSAVKSLDRRCAVAIELKSIFGNFYYSTSIGGAPLADTDVSQVDALIDYLREQGFYMIAVVPAFRDRAFALEHVSSGLALQSGALWVDERQCYWLDPADGTTLSYLMQIARELSSLGFREIAFSDFRFPSSSRINYRSDKTGAELVADAAGTLTAFFESSNLMISFVTDDVQFASAPVTGRIYIPDADGTNVEKYTQGFAACASLRELVFLTASRDVRFDDRAVLRPLLNES